jgi:alkylation response protein AidB-like acyl-CoA dehydrogenase
MSTTAETYESALEKACSAIANNAVAVDRDGAFPSTSIEALKSAGLLGALSATESGGLGLGLAGAARVVRRVAEECGSTAMVLTMHYCGAAVLEKYGSSDIRREAASGAHFSTLAFSETGSRSHFWAPTSTAAISGDRVVLNVDKSWVTSASNATAYVWSSKPLAADGLSTLWLVPISSPGIAVRGPFEGLGLRGNDSSPGHARGTQQAASSSGLQRGGGGRAVFSAHAKLYVGTIYSILTNSRQIAPSS